MKLFRKNLSLQKGFTLIELLVVIAVLGVLAAGVLVAINPLKKINQAKDTRIKSDIGQIAQVFQGEFTLKQYYPLTVAEVSGAGKDLKMEPKTPASASYTVVKTPALCDNSTTAKWCTDVAIYGALNDPATSGNVWCWISSTGVTAETTVAACIP